MQKVTSFMHGAWISAEREPQQAVEDGRTLLSLLSTFPAFPPPLLPPTPPPERLDRAEGLAEPLLPLDQPVFQQSHPGKGRADGRVSALWEPGLGPGRNKSLKGVSPGCSKIGTTSLLG